MTEKREKHSSVMINRAPVLTLWAAVVAEMLGFDYDEALRLGASGKLDLDGIRKMAGSNEIAHGVEQYYCGHGGRRTLGANKWLI